MATLWPMTNQGSWKSGKTSVGNWYREGKRWRKTCQGGKLNCLKRWRCEQYTPASLPRHYGCSVCRMGALPRDTHRDLITTLFDGANDELREGLKERE